MREYLLLIGLILMILAGVAAVLSLIVISHRKHILNMKLMEEYGDVKRYNIRTGGALD